MLTAYSDGSSDNDGYGGWGYTVSYLDGSVKEGSGGSRGTTNNRMELTAAIEVLRFIPVGIPAVIHSDSKYVVDGTQKWVHAWKSNGWKRSNQGVLVDLTNEDLWREIYDLYYLHHECRITMEWVKGHVGNPMNERVDVLAHIARVTLREEDGLSHNRRQSSSLKERVFLLEGEVLKLREELASLRFELLG